MIESIIIGLVIAWVICQVIIWGFGVLDRHEDRKRLKREYDLMKELERIN